MNQRSILITGCSSGIGLASAQYLAARGWRVLATVRKPEDVAALEAQGLEAFVLDLADEASVAAGAEEALRRTEGGLFALFNNGAYASPGAVEDLPRAAWREIFETNLFGQIDLMNRLLPAMRAQGAGRVVMNSSVLGFCALRFRGAYNASKFALEGVTDTLRVENDQPDLHFILIEPGPITSAIRENSRLHFERHCRVAGSHFEKLYHTLLIPRLNAATGAPDRFELPAEAVAKVLERALTAPRPRPRYRVTVPTHLMNIAKRLLTSRAFTALTRKF